MFSCDLYEYCQNNLFIEHLQVTASEYSIISYSSFYALQKWTVLGGTLGYFLIFVTFSKFSDVSKVFHTDFGCFISVNLLMQFFK